MTTGISMLWPGFSRQRTAKAALTGSASPLRRLLLLSGIEPSRLKLPQSSDPSLVGFQRLQRWMHTPGCSLVAMHHWPSPSRTGLETSPPRTTPLQLPFSIHALRCPSLLPMAGA